MKVIYPVILKETKNCILVYVPAFDCNTEGKDYVEAIEMARDVIGVMGIDYQDDNKELPKADLNIKADENEIITLVDVDLLAYRKKHDNKAVRKNVTIPNWLNTEAERLNINFSKVLAEALEKKIQYK